MQGLRGEVGHPQGVGLHRRHVCRQSLRDLKLDPKVLAKIYSSNFLRRVPVTPKPMNLAKARAYCDWLQQQYQLSNPDTPVPKAVKARLDHIRRSLEGLPR
jgi:hypothetical protein